MLPKWSVRHRVGVYLVQCAFARDFFSGASYAQRCDVAGDVDTKSTTLTKMRPVTPIDDMADRKTRERSRKTQAKHRGRATAHVARLDASLSGGLLSRPWKRLFGVSTDVSLSR